MWASEILRYKYEKDTQHEFLALNTYLTSLQNKSDARIYIYNYFFTFFILLSSEINLVFVKGAYWISSNIAIAILEHLVIALPTLR